MADTKGTKKPSVLVVIPVLYYASDGLRAWFLERAIELREAWRRF